jgi:cyclophilin family peptidyl-prolyl cis-trans isomerase
VTSAGPAQLAPGPAIQALGAARRIVDTGRAAAPASWVPVLTALFDHPEPGVRVAALDASAAWLGEPTLSAALARRVSATDLSVWERTRALLALAGGEDPRAEELALSLAQDDDPVLRAAAATAAAELAAPGRAMAEILAEDPSPRVRQAAAESLRASAVAAEVPAAELAAVVAPFLADPDSGVRTGALGFLEDHPVVALDLLERSALSSLQSDGLEERLAAVAAVAARAEAEPTERGSLVRVLETLVTEGELPTRRAAARALEELGGERIAVGAVAISRGAEVYQRMLLEAARPRLARVETDRGAFTLRLHCPDFPLTCLNFLQLAEGGFYDGLVFHRVVPDFVVQAGDPRGDGWGGPGYQIRDEIGRLRYDRGVLGMALAGADTGGSQWFVTLAPQPHLDGGYTAFGEVVAGLEVLDRLHQGDTILSVREVSAGSR